MHWNQNVKFRGTNVVLKTVTGELMHWKFLLVFYCIVISDNVNDCINDSDSSSIGVLLLAIYIFISPNHGSSSMKYSKHNISRAFIFYVQCIDVIQ